ncbi:MAG: phospholipid carrier-dependent glycosyltransferase [Gemmataceae bacterium]|nr:phospholipid carrier-dependent glycosyltransferase [Gemmataceae bacterium]
MKWSSLRLPRLQSSPSRYKFSLVWPSSPFILLLFCALLLSQGIATRSLWASHEARAAQNAQLMLDDGDWLLPRLFDGQVELQKPPGFYWLVAGVGAARGGVDAVAVRLPAILAGMLMVLMIWWHLHRRGRYVAAFVAGVVLVGAVHFTGTARIGRIDVPLACAVTAIILNSRLSPTPRSGEGGARGIWIGVLGGIALLLKGPIGIVLPVAVLGVLCLLERGSIRRYSVLALISGSIALAIAAPWYLWANAATDGEFFRTFFLYHHVNRAFGGAEALAGHPRWYYVPRFAADFLPWTPLLILALVQYCRRSLRAAQIVVGTCRVPSQEESVASVGKLSTSKGESGTRSVPTTSVSPIEHRDSDARFGLIWLVVMILVLSISRFKRADYLLPAYGGAAIFLGCAIERWYLERSAKHRQRLLAAFIVSLALLPVGWLAFDRIVTAREGAARDQEAFATRVRELAPQPHEIVLFRVESHQLGYHLGRPIHTLVEWSDLNVRLREPGPHFIVTRAEFLDEVRQYASCVPEVISRSEDVSAVRQHRPLILLRFHGQPCPNQPKD